jgi:plastocyanin
LAWLAAAWAPAATPAARVAKTPDQNGAVQIVAHNLAFDTDDVLAAAGTITIELDNRDGGTPHNLHLFHGDNARGESIGETSIQNGPAQETLKVDVTAGRYFFQCDVHPNMNGVITIS